MTATMDAPEQTADEQLVAKGPEGIVFLSRRRELRLVMEPRYPIHGQAGQKIGETKGRSIQFMDGRYLTDDEEELAFLRGQQTAHLRDDNTEGFWEVEPTAPAPTLEEQMAMMKAATSFNVELMRTMLAQEEAGWARPQLVEPLREGIAAIEELAAQAAAQQG